MKRPAFDKMTGGAGKSAGDADVVAPASLLRTILKFSFVSVGVLALAFAVSAYLYNQFAHYESELRAWPPQSQFVAPVQWKPDNPNKLRVLAIDGGGVDGIVTLEILKYLEEQSGQPIAKQFDFISGTSTGAIITVGLLLTDGKGRPQYSADRLITEYSDLAQKILYAPLYHRLLTLNGLLGPRLLNHARIVMGQDIFANRRLADLSRPALLPVFSRKASGLETFRNWTERGANMLIGPAVAAATSAPTYFPAVQLQGNAAGDGLYADAALIVDNPAQLAFLHALQQFPDGDFVVVSLGTRHRRDVSLHDGVSGGALEWFAPMRAMVINGQEDISTSTLDVLQNARTSYHLKAFRMAPEIPWDDSQFNGSAENIARLRQFARDYIATHKDELGKIIEALQAQPGRTADGG
ncbi:patatin-like phospholipase family protein [Bradyrhizobium sp. LHD-71]|uniref:patatin-like phospholipase family protein n=1 Tax=Bradyrhizobium sp. LHD-71 TaxID=3072141 RepID=UPI00280FCE3B|nr:patatin-like phospholipase family protein [Bradyrhizobium sp. LHD-71]MDQ8729455.1 patatin-like phospholipase family protein [Bradyrhizobium sp. LHD-71]